MLIFDQSEERERLTFLQRLQMCVSTQGLKDMSIEEK
jgi:hypothetical protein